MSPVLQAASPPARALLRWYDRHRRALPWRALPGETPDPYHVWLSEVMLQQTTVAAVGPYYAKFLHLFPTVQALAAAADAEVMKAWAGLGYYARARNLHACAKEVAALGAFPRNEAALRALPGIGPYTAAAIAAIAFDIPAMPVDGNVERVVSRLYAITDELPRARPRLTAQARALAQDRAARRRPADFAQAMFDLGATICTPANPACGLCPWNDACAGHTAGIAATLPRKAPKTPRPQRHGAQFYLRDAERRVLLRRRDEKGLLGGMMELPGTPWRDAQSWDARDVLAHAPMQAAWEHAGTVRHVFTHFELTLDVYAADVIRITAAGTLHDEAALAGEALPSVMMKCVRRAIAHRKSVS